MSKGFSIEQARADACDKLYPWIGCAKALILGEEGYKARFQALMPQVSDPEPFDIDSFEGRVDAAARICSAAQAKWGHNGCMMRILSLSYSSSMIEPGMPDFGQMLQKRLRKELRKMAMTTTNGELSAKLRGYRDDIEHGDTSLMMALQAYRTGLSCVHPEVDKQTSNLTMVVVELFTQWINDSAWLPMWLYLPELIESYKPLGWDEIVARVEMGRDRALHGEEAQILDDDDFPPKKVAPSIKVEEKQTVNA